MEIEATAGLDYLCIVDLEATCWEKRTALQNEIIEIGAVMLNLPTLIEVSEFQSFVKPRLHPQLSTFCTQLTSISQADVDSADVFEDVNANFIQWLNRYQASKTLFASWGRYDNKQWSTECRIKCSPFPFVNHLNLKEVIVERLVQTIQWSKKKRGLNKVVEGLGLTFDGQQHRGIVDARTVAKVVQMVGL